MDKKEQEDLTLSRFVIDRQLWNEWREAGSDLFTPPPLEDEFSNSLDKLTKEGVLSVALVFEARVFLDIQDIMGDDVSRGHQDLLRTTNRIEKIMNLKAVDGEWDVGGTGERWHERDVDVVMRIKSTSMYWILDTPTNTFPKLKQHQIAMGASDNEEPLFGPDVSPQDGPLPQQADIPEDSGPERLQNSKRKPPRSPKFSNLTMKVHRVPEGADFSDPEVQRRLKKQMMDAGELPDERLVDPKHEESARRLNIKMIQPSKDLNFLLTTNPIYCGLVSFSMLTDFEASGISLCNWHKSIWPTAHLYNALQQTSSISNTWPEMEELMDLHMDALFAGHLPLSAYEFFIRFALALGLSTSNFSRNPRNRTNNDRVRFRQGANGTKLKITQMSSIFRQYFEKKSSLEICLVKLDSLIRDPGRGASRKERDASKRPLTNLQFLAMLEASLPRVTQRLKFDYITVTKQCAKLLKTIRQQLELQFQLVYPRIPTEDSADQTLTWVVMQLLEENNELVRLHCASLTPRHNTDDQRKTLPLYHTDPIYRHQFARAPHEAYRLPWSGHNLASQVTNCKNFLVLTGLKISYSTSTLFPAQRELHLGSCQTTGTSPSATLHFILLAISSSSCSPTVISCTPRGQSKLSRGRLRDTH